jgi:hypothetical protein
MIYCRARKFAHPQTPVRLTMVPQICFFVVHWAACGFYYIAKQGGFAATSWVGAAEDWIGGANTIEL